MMSVRSRRIPLANHQAGRRALTLLELVVVMVILAALAGILVPLLPNLARKAHTTAGATNLGEIAKAFQLYAAQHGDNYPNQLDSITTGTTVASYVPTTASATLGTAPLYVDSPTSAEVSALSDTGITQLAPMIEKPSESAGSWSPTSYPYGTVTTATPTYNTIDTSDKLAMLNPAVAAAKLGRPTTGRYAVFGYGKFATINGDGTNEAPIWYSPAEGNDPASRYCRFGLVFQVSDSAATSFPRAKLVGVVEFGPWGTMTKDDNLGYHYSLK